MIFSGAKPKDIHQHRSFEAMIHNKINSHTPNLLNDVITHKELERSIPMSKSNAVGLDQIQNKMLKNFSAANKTSLLHLFNTLTKSANVPELWKKAVVIRLLKQHEPVERPNLYRPVLITYCLGKMFKRILANCRLLVKKARTK